jgi:hypothetical protein
MSPIRRRVLLAALFPPLLAAASPPSGGPYVLTRQAIAEGGVSTGGSLRLTTSAAQPEAAPMAGGNYRLTAGLLGRGGPAVPADRIFSDSFE